MRILAISGSLRDGSYNTALLRALREEAPEGVEVDIWQGLKVIPPYDQDDDVVPGPEAVEAFRELAASFFSKECAPNEAKWAEQQHVDREIWNKAGSFEGRSAFSSWLYRVTANAALMALRKRRKPRDILRIVWRDDQ